MRPKAAPGTLAVYGKDGTFISLDFGAACSYFQSVPFFVEIPRGTYFWQGISLGVGVSAKALPKTGLGIKTGWRIKPDIANIFKNFGPH